MQTIYESFVSTAGAVPHSAFLCLPGTEVGASVDISYETAAASVQQLRAEYRRAEFGHGHRVAILLGQGSDFVYHYLALNGLGCAIVPLNPDYRRDELMYVIDHSEAVFVVTTAERVDEVRDASRGLSREVEVADVARFSARMSASNRIAAAPEAPGLNSLSIILYTSGTTGRPKGCMLTNDCVIIAGAWYRDVGGVLSIVTGKDRFYNPSPFHHVNNLVVTLTCVILTRNCLIVAERFAPSRWWAEIISCRATVAHYLGVVPSLLMAAPASLQDRGHTVRFGFGAGIEPQLHGPFEERFGFPLVEIWGMTEIPRIYAANFEPRRVDTRAFGRAAGENEGRVVDDAGNDVPVGTPGEFIVRTKGDNPRRGFFCGYLKNEQATSDAWRDGWFYTGDIVSRGDDGMFYFVDRKKNIIRRGGENISAVEVEAIILLHESVAQVACIAVRDELREEEVMACIVPREGESRTEETARSIVEWCKQKIAYYKAPGWITFLDSLPLTASQRLQRTRIFPPNVDPRSQPGTIDLRSLKKRSR